MKFNFNPFLDLLFPRSCEGCHILLEPNQTDPLCPSCLKSFPWITGPVCDRCGSPLQDEPNIRNLICGECIRNSWSFDKIESAARYDDPAKILIHKFKYGGNINIGQWMGRCLALKIQSSPIPFDIILPVPLHRKKLKSRGFNQSLILAKEIAKNNSLTLKRNLLIKSLETPSQSQLKRNDRLKAFKNSPFQVKSEQQPLHGLNVLLVDDVATTNATIHASAKILKDHGAKKVHAITFAKTTF